MINLNEQELADIQRWFNSHMAHSKTSVIDLSDYRLIIKIYLALGEELPESITKRFPTNETILGNYTIPIKYSLFNMYGNVKQSEDDVYTIPYFIDCCKKRHV